VNSKILFSSIAAVAMLAASSAIAEQVKMKAELSGAQEVPPTTSQGKGNADITFDTASKQLSWTVNYSGLSGPPPRRISMDRRRPARMQASPCRYPTRPQAR